MNRFFASLIARPGTVRVNLGYPRWTGRPGVRAPDLTAARKAATWLAERGLIADRLAIDTPERQVVLDGAALERFLRHGVIDEAPPRRGGDDDSLRPGLARGQATSARGQAPRDPGLR